MKWICTSIVGMLMTVITLLSYRLGESSIEAMLVILSIILICVLVFFGFVFYKQAHIPEKEIEKWKNEYDSLKDKHDSDTAKLKIEIENLKNEIKNLENDKKHLKQTIDQITYGFK